MHKMVQVTLKYEPLNKRYDYLKLTHCMCFHCKIKSAATSKSSFLKEFSLAWDQIFVSVPQKLADLAYFRQELVGFGKKT